MMKRILSFGGSGGGAFRRAWHSVLNTFLLLTDTPNSYAAKATNVLQVNAAENALEFIPGRGVANGFASLNALGLIPDAQIPPLAITDFLGTVASQVAMLALTGERGDWCIRSDTGVVFVIVANDGHLITDWQQLEYPATPVHDFGGVLHSADTIANLKTKVSDGSLYTTAASEISATTLKATPSISDLLLIEDSADTNNKKRITIETLPGIRCYYADFTYAQLAAAALSNSQLVFAIPGGGMLIAARLKVNTVFTGGAITKYYLSLGTATDIDSIMSEYDQIGIAVGNAEYAESLCFQSFDYANTVNLYLWARSIGANLDQANQGSCRVEMFYITRFF